MLCYSLEIDYIILCFNLSLLPDSGHFQARLNAIARQLNERPRKTLEFEAVDYGIGFGFRVSR